MSAPLGPFAVSADTAEVASFRSAARLRADEGVPFTFPIRWLARPEIRTALVELMPEPGLVPFHESQTFDYAAPLKLGTAYAMNAAVRREHDPERLVIEGRVAQDDATVATVETVLRLFATGQAA